MNMRETIAVVQSERFDDAAARQGCSTPHPFMLLAFMPLSVIPELKTTDRGLVDVTTFDFASIQD